MRTVMLTCADQHVDPAHILGFELGKAAVIRNHGGRGQRLWWKRSPRWHSWSRRWTGPNPPMGTGPHATYQMRRERFAGPNFQRALKEHIRVDVSSSAIADHEQSLREDVERLRSAPNVPGYIAVSGYISDVQHGMFAKSSPRPALRRLDREASILHEGFF